VNLRKGCADEFDWRRYGPAFDGRVHVKSISGGVTCVGSGPGITLSLGGQKRGMTSYMNDLAITTVAVQGDKAVVRFAKR
jgi:hypothetical protein